MQLSKKSGVQQSTVRYMLGMLVEVCGAMVGRSKAALSGIGSPKAS